MIHCNHPLSSPYLIDNLFQNQNSASWFHDHATAVRTWNIIVRTFRAILNLNCVRLCLDVFIGLRFFNLFVERCFGYRFQRTTRLTGYFLVFGRGNFRSVLQCFLCSSFSRCLKFGQSFWSHYCEVGLVKFVNRLKKISTFTVFFQIFIEWSSYQWICSCRI